MFGPALRSKSVYLNYKIETFPQQNGICLPIKRSITVQGKRGSSETDTFEETSMLIETQQQTRFQTCAGRYESQMVINAINCTNSLIDVNS